MGVQERAPSPWERAKAEIACDCSQSEYRFRVFRNGQRVWVRQCVHCGQWGNNIAKEAVPFAARCAAVEVDEELQRRWYERLSERARELAEEDREAEREARFSELQEYYASPWWRMRRQQRLEFDRYQCQARLPKCEQRATQVHHLPEGYKFLGREPLFVIVSVCDYCHCVIHPHMEGGE